MHLSLDVLPEMASAGVALVPTAATFLAARPQMDSEEVPSGLREWFGSGLDRHADLVRAAVAAGVTVLAGTDLATRVVDRGEPLARRGGNARGRRSRRCVLGGTPLARDTRSGGRWPADLLVLPGDPREDLSLLDRPDLVVIRGRVVD